MAFEDGIDEYSILDNVSLGDLVRLLRSAQADSVDSNHKQAGSRISRSFLRAVALSMNDDADAQYLNDDTHGKSAASGLESDCTSVDSGRADALSEPGDHARLVEAYEIIRQYQEMIFHYQANMQPHRLNDPLDLHLGELTQLLRQKFRESRDRHIVSRPGVYDIGHAAPRLSGRAEQLYGSPVGLELDGLSFYDQE